MQRVEPPGAEGAVAEALDVVRSVRTYVESLRLMGTSDLPVGGREKPSPAGGASSDDLETFRAKISDCRECKLSESRRTVVFGSGNPRADIMFVGEAPGAEEDRQGLPFVGAAGALLTRMIQAIGFEREDVYIANVIKCRPPGNRDPQPDEVCRCEPFLHRQIEIVGPTVICTLGRFAAQSLLGSSEPIGKLRGRVFTYRGIKLVPTYHPAALLRNPKWKRSTWEDLKRLRFEYDRTTI